MSEIGRVVEDFLDTHSSQGKSRTGLIELLDSCAKEVYDKLAVEDYHMEQNERSLRQPFDPDFQSEESNEHESRLETDEDYAEMTRRNAEIREDATMGHEQNESIGSENEALQAN
jgi:hypothetical protein